MRPYVLVRECQLAFSALVVGSYSTVQDCFLVILLLLLFIMTIIVIIRIAIAMPEVAAMFAVVIAIAGARMGAAIMA